MISRRIFTVTLAVVISGHLVGCDDSARKIKQVRELRDEAIRNIGWIAGNLRGQQSDAPVFRTDLFAPGGDLYDVYVNLALSDFGEKPRERAGNEALYREWVERGAGEPFDEAGIDSRLKRIDELSEKLVPAMRDLVHG